MSPREVSPDPDLPASLTVAEKLERTRLMVEDMILRESSPDRVLAYTERIANVWLRRTKAPEIPTFTKENP